MAKAFYKYMDIDVIAFLEEKMKSNTKSYQSDFEIDKRMLQRLAQSRRKEDKALLWMSRPMGTHLQRESEAFIRNTHAHNTWRFYAEQTSDPIVAIAVELTGTKDGIIRGNLYELDYKAHAAEVASKSVEDLEVEKVFADGFVDCVPLARSSYGYWAQLVDEHGSIVDSLEHPKDKEQLALVLAQQKASRDKMKIADISKSKPKMSLADQIQAASSRTGINDPAINAQKHSFER